MTNWNIEQILKHPLSVEELIKTLYVIEDLKDCKYPNDEILHQQLFVMKSVK